MYRKYIKNLSVNKAFLVLTLLSLRFDVVLCEVSKYCYYLAIVNTYTGANTPTISLDTAHTVTHDTAGVMTVIIVIDPLLTFDYNRIK